MNRYQLVFFGPKRVQGQCFYKEVLLGVLCRILPSAAFRTIEHFKMFRSIYAYHLPKSVSDANEEGIVSAGVLALGLLEDASVHGLQNTRKAKGQT